MRRFPLALACALTVIAAKAIAQDPSARPPVPQILTTATGEVRVTPDRATIAVGVQSRATTVAEASSANARKQRAVIDAIKAKGVPADQIATSSFNVIPETRYDREGQAAPRTTSYLVVNAVTIELKRIDQVGPVIDAALAAGANQVNSLTFSVASADSARRAALAIAVANARADAEVMARAAGGTLGPLLEMSASDIAMPVPMTRMSMAMKEAQGTAVPIEPGQETVRATISARWQFLQR